MCRYVHTLFILNILTRQLHMKTQTAQNHSLKSRCLFFSSKFSGGSRQSSSGTHTKRPLRAQGFVGCFCYRPRHIPIALGVPHSSCVDLRQRLFQQAVQRDLNQFTSCVQIQQSHIQARWPVSYIRVRSYPFKPH